MDCSASRTAPAWISSLGCSPAGTDCSSMRIPPSPVRSQVLKSAPVQAPLHSFTDPDRSLLHHDLPAGSKPPSDIHLLQYGILCGLHVDLCSNMHHHRLQGHSCLAMVFSTSCRGTSGQHLEHLLPLPHCSWCLQGSCSYVVSLLCSLAANTPVQ